jgi:chemotaxis signal transduction protein
MVQAHEFVLFKEGSMHAMMTQTSDDETEALKAKAGQYLICLVSGECYAIGILDVQEIIEVGRITRVPMTPAHIRGVINLRGSVVAVVDLSARVAKSASQLSKRRCIILVEVSVGEERQSLGMLVDEGRRYWRSPSKTCNHHRPSVPTSALISSRPWAG